MNDQTETAEALKSKVMQESSGLGDGQESTVANAQNNVEKSLAVPKPQQDGKGQVIKEGYLLKRTSSFQRWQRRYFKVTKATLVYGKSKAAVQVGRLSSVSLSQVTQAEYFCKAYKHCFQVITKTRILSLACEESREEMEEWMESIRASSVNDCVPSSKEIDKTDKEMESIDCRLLCGAHTWYVASHARPTYCNVCRDQLSGVTFHGLSCEICKYKCHKHCTPKVSTPCKWTTLASVGGDILEDSEGNLKMRHQWLEGNLPVSAKCAVCERNCGSVMRLQDWKCLWCRMMVHAGCKLLAEDKCGIGKISVLPPTALHSVENDESWELCSDHLGGRSPLLVFVNSKSGDHQGMRFLRRFRQLLNPAQVFDLIQGGPRLGLQLFRHFEPFRILVCGGDGSVGWVMSEIDKLDIQRQCRVGVLPLGTGNDLARVLGWGSCCDDDANLSHLLDRYETATTKMLDRWSVMTFEKGVVLEPPQAECSETQECEESTELEKTVVSHIRNFMTFNDHEKLIESTKFICEILKDMIFKVGHCAAQDESLEAEKINNKCTVVVNKLDALLNTLEKEESEQNYQEDVMDDVQRNINSGEKPRFAKEDILMRRATSLRNAVHQIIQYAESKLDDQNEAYSPLVVVRPMTLPFKSHEPCTSNFPISCNGDGLYTSFDSSTSNATHVAKAQDSLRRLGKTEVPMISIDSPPSEGPSEGYVVEACDIDLSDDILMPRNGQASELLNTAGGAEGGDVSPRACRRVSVGSLCYKPLEIEVPVSFERSGSSCSPASAPWSYHSSPCQPTKRKGMPIVNPLISHPSWPTVPSEGGIVSKVLLANADTMCAVASPLMDPDSEDLMIGFEEKFVMNNYFGIGIDAKITLDFHLKREEHPEKCRSRARNFMWYGVLGSKEFLQKSCKNLDQRIQLECDGKRLPLPSLQGIVVLNIQSFMGGTNFWGGDKEDECFLAPSFDDKILEVVAVFDSVQMAASRLINLQRHRIAQCHQVKITILGDEPIPVQVDGEARLQPAGVIRIVHKNKMQMLCRNRALESSLRRWEEKQRSVGAGSSGAETPLTPPHDSDEVRGNRTVLKDVKYTQLVAQNETSSY